MNRVGSVAYGAAIIALIFLCAQEMNGSALFLYDYSTPPMFALGLAGWAVATFGPLIFRSASGAWRSVSARDGRYTFSSSPAPLRFSGGGYGLLHYASGSPVDSMAEGLFMILALLFLCLTGMVHAGALIAELTGMFRRRADVR